MYRKVNNVKNQITLPKELVNQLAGQHYFDARLENNKIILEPVIIRPIETPELTAIRDKTAVSDLTEQSIPDIVAEARNAYGS
jgi:hypothetical protein